MNDGTPTPIQLLTLPESAYHPGLSLTDDAAYLLTAHSAYRLVAGEAARRFDLDLGTGATLTRSDFVFWSQGAVYRVPTAGGERSRVCDYPHQPQYFVSAGDRFAWIDRSDEGAFTIQTPERGRAQTLIATAGAISAATMLSDWVFFVESLDSGWRIGGSYELGKAIYSSLHEGRPPASLTADTRTQQLFYYDVDRYEITVLSPDLRHEQAWVRDVVCSPIAVAGSAYCGSVESLYAVSSTSTKPLPLVANTGSLVTRIAADINRVVYLRDVGADRLSVEMLVLPSR